MLLLLALLPTVAIAQNTFQNTIFDLPAQLGGEPVGVAAQAQGAPLLLQTADQKPPAPVGAQLPNAVPVPAAPQAVTVAPFTFPTLPTVAPFALPSHPTIAPFTLPTHAPFTFPTHPPLVFPPPSTPAPFVPPSPYAFVPQQGYQQQNNFQPYNGYPQQQQQQQQQGNQYYNYNNGNYNQQQQYNGYNNNNQQQQQYNNYNQQQQIVQQPQQPQVPQQPQPQPQVPHQSVQPVQPQQPPVPSPQNGGPQQVQSFESNTQIVQPVRAVQANAQVVQPVLKPAAKAVATAVVDTDSSAKKASEFNKANAIEPPKPAHAEKASLDAEVDANVDRHLWFAADYDVKQCRKSLNGIGVRFQKKFPSYLQKGGKDRELAELVEQRLLECERKSSASHWDKVDTLLQKISLTKSEEGECRAGLIQERISCVNLLKYTCQFVDSSYHFKLVPARITIQEARQAESGAEKCRQVIRIVKQRLESGAVTL
ncbi:hypothetical protein L3Y34_001406 [Caenorhabditis briggsae]|uniref:Uncharacterized protein n=1 Tax=Caenorhabditis briggsae TaxID=6238 RepID=A0AAE9DCK4_CAEBR|nr:hypothetical protein L3Y34_001406 [Caenorhabditis briggsae]